MIPRAAAALTWDGARHPARRLPVRARAFLGPVTPAKKLAALLAQGGPAELRICWVPRLRGGEDVLLPPFETRRGKRLAFRLMRTVAFGPVLGAVYRRKG
jgi:hypothetical protein